MLNYLIHSFDSDVVTVDYRVRGFTRDVDGTKHYIDHDINSIQNYLTEDTQNAYQMIDVNVYQENLFHTKMMLKNFNLDNYVFGVNAGDLDPAEAQSIEDRLRREMLEIFTPATSNDRLLWRPARGVTGPSVFLMSPARFLRFILSSYPV